MADDPYERRWLGASIPIEHWHFHRRLLARYGLVLAPGEFARMMKDIRSRRALLVETRPRNRCVFSVRLGATGERIFVVMVGLRLVTALKPSAKLRRLRSERLALREPRSDGGVVLNARATIGAALALTVALTVTGALAAPGRAKPASEDAPSPALKQRIAALALKQVDFGSVSLLPVRFAGSRLAGPIEDGGRTIYCVSSRMSGRSFGKPERPKAVMRYAADRLEVIDDDEVCTGHRSQPFPELDALGNAR